MEPEFAPQYSPKERRWRLLLHGVLCVLMTGAVYWAVTHFRSLSADAPCEALFGVPGSTLLLYGGFVGMPLAAAILIVLLTARSSIFSIATRRYPPPGRKVYGRVKVKRGWQAVVFALVPAMFITYLCVLSSQGMAMAAQMAIEAQRSATCGAQPKAQAAKPHKEERQDPGRDTSRRRSSR